MTETGIHPTPFDPEKPTFTPGCPNECAAEKPNWVSYTKNGFNYAKACPIHNPDWEHPDQRYARRAQEAKDEAELRRQEKVRRTKGLTQSSEERADW